ncbi:MFS transporter [Nocardia sp. NPDC004722]
MINDISADLNTSVQGIQVAITIFLLVMAALMIPGGKLTERYGSKRCFVVGLSVYGVGAVVSAVAPSLGVLILGNSILEGIGTALLIPPVYILTTLLFTEAGARARAFGTIMAMGGVGAAAGPLIGGFIAFAISWRAAFVFQALVVAAILLSARLIHDPLPGDRTREFDLGGAARSATGLILLVAGILVADDNLWWTVLLTGLGAAVLAWFFVAARARQRRGLEPLLAPGIFADRTANLGLVTQHLQWLVLMGTSFVVATYLQVVRGYNAIQTGVIFTAATLGILLTSLSARRLSRRHTRRTLIVAGFAVTAAGIVVLLALAGSSLSPWAFTPGLLLIGLGLGVMLTPSVDVVQSSFGQDRQGEISGLSRSISNLGSSVGTAVVGTILVIGPSAHAYATAMTVLAAVALAGLACAGLLPNEPA